MQIRLAESMTRFLFINTTVSWNKGSAAQIISTMKTVRESIPDAQFSLISYCYSLDKGPGPEEGIAVVGYPDDENKKLGRALIPYIFRLLVCIALGTLRRIVVRFGGRGDFASNERFCGAILRSDVVIDLSGDSLSDRGAHSFINLLGMLAVVILGRPIVCYSQSIGPFSKLTAPWARELLNRTEQISVRETISRDMMLELGVSRDKIHVYGDCAFVLPTASDQRVSDIFSKEGIPASAKRLVGVSVSSLMIDILSEESSSGEGLAAKYKRILVGFVDDITIDPENHVILIPHVISPRYWMTDDRAACNLVHEEVNRQDQVHTLDSDYSAQELKGVIGKCEFFVGSRMHACIAALSQGIPTVTIGWSHKYDGIMSRLGQGNLALNLTRIGGDEVLGRLRAAFDERDEISISLSAASDLERASAQSGADIIVDVARHASPSG